jgi:hypothetical protein
MKLAALGFVLGASFTRNKVFCQTQEFPTPNKLSTVQKVNEDLYIGRRAQDNDLHFAMTRLTDKNIDLWWSVVELGAGNQICPEGVVFNQKWTTEQKAFFCQLQNGGCAFRETLIIYENAKTQPAMTRPEIWISYCLSGTNIDPSKPLNKELLPNVEMVMTATTHPDVPLVVHMGIMRTAHNLAKIYHGLLPQHKNISIPLHTFTAKALRSTPQGNTKLWLTTGLADTMARIFERDLPQGSFMTNSRREMNGALVITHDAQNIELMSNYKKDDPKLAFYHRGYMDDADGPYTVSYPFLADLF